MKKIYVLLLTAVMLFLYMSCGKKDDVQEPEVTGDLGVLMEQIYTDSGITDLPALVTGELTEENTEYYLGTNAVQFTEGLASEPMANAIAHSIVLFRVEKGSDYETIKQTVKDSVNGWKWICVGVDYDKILTGNKGNLIVLILDRDSDKYLEAFNKLEG